MDEQRLAELLEQMFERIGFGDLAKNMSKVNKGLTEAQQKAKAQTELVKRTQEAFDKLNKKLETGSKKAVDLGDSLKSLNESIEDVKDANKRKKLEDQRDALAQKFLMAQTNKAMNDFYIGLSGTLVKGIWKSTTTLVKNLQSGGSGVQLAADLMTTAVDTTQSAFVGVAKTGQSLGTAMLAVGGKAAKLGGWFTVGATALEYFTNAVAGATKEGIQLLATEAEKQIKAFNTAASAGALFGRGMDDLRHSATLARLTVDQFAEVIKNNSTLLAESGYTVTDAAVIVGNITSRFAVQTGKSGQTLQREMLNLGIGFTEQAELVTQIIADLKRTGTGQTTSRGELAIATVEIAKNMKTVADLMGEEAKARADAVKKQTEEYAFFVKINQRAKELNDPTLPARMREVFKLMDDETRRTVMQAYVLDGAVTTVAGNLTGAADMVGRPMADAINRGQVSFENLSGIVGRFGDKMLSGVDETGFALSRLNQATGEGAEYANAFTQGLQNARRVNSETLAKGLEGVDTLAGAQGGLQGELMGVEQQAQSLKMAIQDILTPSVVAFGQVSNEVIASVRKAVAKLSGTTPPPPTAPGGKFNPANWNAGQLAGGGMVLAGGLMSMTGIGAAVGLPLAQAGLVTAAGGTLADFAGFADGGISQGPESGYPTTLHGTEAVVPLPDGKTIPVNMDTSALTAAVHQQSGILNEMLKTMRDTNSLTSGILQHTM